MKTHPSNTHEITPLAYRIDHACRAVGLGRSTLYKLIGEGALRAVKIGGRTLIPADEIERLLRDAKAV